MDNDDTINMFRNSIKELERKANMSICEYCSGTHVVRLHVGNDLQITPIYPGGRPCDGYMRDLMRAIRALQNRMGRPENIC